MLRADRAGQPAVARLHLVDRPLERGLGALGFGDDRHEQVGQPVVGRQLDPLEVHQDHPHVVGRRLAQQARDHRVDHDALARAGRPGDEQVRHLGQVDRLGHAGHVATEREGQLRLGRGELDLLEDTPQGHRVEVLVRDLDADRALARDRRLDPERVRGEGHGQVVGQGLDPAELDVGRRVDLVLRDDGSGVAADDARRDAEAGQLLDDDLLVAGVERFVATGMERDRDVVEGRDRRQDVLDPVLGERRVAGIGDVVRVAHGPDRGDQRRRRRTGAAGGREGAGRLALARDGGGDGQLLALAPDAGLTRRRGGGDGLAVGPRSGVGGDGRLAGRGGRDGVVVGRGPSHRGGGGRPEPPGGADRRVHEPPQRDPEPDDDPEDRQTDEQDERTGRGEPVGQRARQRSPDATTGHAEDLGGTHDPDVGDAHAQERDPPARPGPRPGTPFEPPAGDQQEERQQPAHRPEPRREDPGPPPGQGALARQHQRDERHRAQHEQRQPDDRADDLGRDPRAPGARGRARPRGAGRCLASRRATARRHVRPRRRPGRPSAAASSARTGSATRRP